MGAPADAEADDGNDAAADEENYDKEWDCRVCYFPEIVPSRNASAHS